MTSINVKETNASECSREESMSFCLLGAGFNTENRGVAALASGTISSIFHNFPSAQVFLLDYEREPRSYEVQCSGSTKTVELVNLRFSKRIWLQNNIARLILTALLIRLLPSVRLRRRALLGNPYLKGIYEADIIGSIAGGDSFSDIYGLGRLFYVSLPQILVLCLGKPLVLLPQTLGPFKSVVGRFIGRLILRSAKVVYTRDSEGLEYGRKLCGGDVSRFRFCYDVAHVMEPVCPSERKVEALGDLEGCRPLVGLNVSGLLYEGGYGGGNMFGIRPDYRALIPELIRYFVGQGAHVLLVPHVFGTAADSESDSCAIAEIYRDLKPEFGEKLHAVEGEFNHQEIKFLIGKCDFFLGSRMHACIAALSQCIPAVGLAYSRKFAGVFRAIGMEGICSDLCSSDQADVLTLVRKAYQFREDLRRRLEIKMPQVKDSVFALFDEVECRAFCHPKPVAC